MDSILCFFGLYVIYRLRDASTYRPETWWDGREHMREQLHEGIFWIFGIQDGHQMDYIVKKSFVFNYAHF